MSIFDTSALSVDNPCAKKRRVGSATSPPTAATVRLAPDTANSAPPTAPTVEPNSNLTAPATAVPPTATADSATTAVPPTATADSATPNKEPLAVPLARTDGKPSPTAPNNSWYSGILVTIEELELHKDAIERYIVACLQAKAFTTDDRAYCNMAAAHILTRSAAVPKPLGTVGRLLESTLNNIFLRHECMFVDYCGQFDAHLAEHAAALVIRQHAIQHIQDLVLHSRLCHTLPDKLVSAVRRRV